jgi:hypothetical protein
MITHDALVVARRVYRLAMTADHCARDGDEARARVLLSELASVAAAQLPLLDLVIAAQEKGLILTQRTVSGPASLGHRAAEYLNPANDHPNPVTPSQPGNTLA